jgi:phosphoribosylformylglycinamidine (FGAM) synthase-like enzyme
LALATDGNGRWCQLNPRVGAIHAVAEAARNVAASGARPIAATNCLNFGSPEKPDVMWQFSEVIDGLAVACNELGTPITGGNVSFYNETLGKSIYPTPVIGILGILEDASRVLKITFRAEGDVILLLDGSNSPASSIEAQHTALLQGNQSSDAAREFSSSEYSKTIAGIVSGEPPAIDLAAEKRLIDCLVALASEGSVQSAHDISDGGIAVTLAESCFVAAPSVVGARHAAPVLGASVNLDADGPAEHALFNERGARCVVSVSPTKLAAVLATARQCGVGAREIGKVNLGNALRIEYRGSAVVDSPLDALRSIWANSLERILAKQ